jgi:hypothetical protein
VHPDENNIYTPDTNRVLRIMQELDPEVEGHARPRLRREIHDAVVRSAVDLPWLAERHGIRFDGIDYGLPFQASDTTWELDRVDRICPVDPLRRDRLLMLLMQRLSGRKEAEPVRFAAALPPQAAPGDAAVGKAS